MFFPISPSLNKLFEKWTIPVIAIAISTGKNNMNAGVRIVPKPKPEKKVRREAKQLTTIMIAKSITSVAEYIFEVPRFGFYCWSKLGKKSTNGHPYI